MAQMRKKNSLKIINPDKIRSFVRKKGTLPGIILCVIILVFAVVLLFSGSRVHNAEDAAALIKGKAAQLGYDNAASELTEVYSKKVGEDSYYRLKQNYHGIPVYGRTAVYVTDSQGRELALVENLADIPEDLDLTPAITPEQAEQSLMDHMARQSSQQMPELSGEVTLDEAALCIYDLENTAHLAYELRIWGMTFLVDAHNAEILHSYSSIRTAQATFSSGSGINVPRLKDGSYVLKDESSGIYVYSAGGRTYFDGEKLRPQNLTAVSSPDNVFGNGNDSVNPGSIGRAEASLDVVKRIKEYYEQTLGEDSIDTLVLVYDDAFLSSNGRNACGWWAPAGEMLTANLFYDQQQDLQRYTGLISLGTAYSMDPMQYADVVAHEFTHAVTAAVVYWAENSGQNKAINEAFSDIFGELIQAELENTDPDWDHHSRMIADPSLRDYPEKIGDKLRFPDDAEDNNFADWAFHKDGFIFVRDENGHLVTTDISHGYSTIISHAAYKMWAGRDGVPTSRLSTEELQELWYRTMLMLPADAEFSDCRATVELAAQIMKLNTTKRNWIADVFDAAGIKDKEEEDGYTYEAGLNFRLEVYGADFAPVDRYTITVEEQDKRVDPVNFTSTVEAGAVCALSLEKGIYQITLTNLADTAQYVSFSVNCKEGGQTVIPIYTKFTNPAPEAGETQPAQAPAAHGAAEWALERWDRSFANETEGWTNLCYYDHVVLQGGSRVHERITEELRYLGYSHMNRYADEQLQAAPITDEGDAEGLNRVLSSQVTHNSDGVFSVLLTDGRGTLTGATYSLELGCPLGLGMLTGMDSDGYLDKLCAAAAQQELGYDVGNYLASVVPEQICFYVREGEIVLLLPEAPDQEQMAVQLPTGIMIDAACLDALQGAFQKPGTGAVEDYEVLEWDRGVSDVFGTKYHALYYTLAGADPAYQTINEDLYRYVEQFMTYRTDAEINRKYYDPQFQENMGFSMLLTVTNYHDQDGLVCFDLDYYHYLPGQGIHRGRHELVYDLSAGNAISLSEMAGMEEQMLLKLLRERILAELPQRRMLSGGREVVESLTLADLNYGVHYQGEIVIMLPVEGILDYDDETWAIDTGIYIH